MAVSCLGAAQAADVEVVDLDQITRLLGFHVKRSGARRRLGRESLARRADRWMHQGPPETSDEVLLAAVRGCPTDSARPSRCATARTWSCVPFGPMLALRGRHERAHPSRPRPGPGRAFTAGEAAM